MTCLHLLLCLSNIGLVGRLALLYGILAGQAADSS